jgi:mono/diheme cytochrome c family protein
LSAALVYSLGNEDALTPVAIPVSKQRSGDSAKGYEYLITGDFLKSGVPYKYYTYINGSNEANLLNRTGKNATIGHGYNVVRHKGVDMVIPTCMQCHSHTFEGKLIIGLGNNSLDFSNTKQADFSKQLKLMKAVSPRQYSAAKAFFTSFTTAFPLMETEVRGVNTADKLAIVLVSHRDPQTLKWSDSALLKIPDEVVPTDVPAWWLMKKKNAMFYNGFARGDFAKYLMLSNLLTVSDSSEAREVSNHFGDVLTYIRSLNPPIYPHEISKQLADGGRLVFNENCSKCHGTYGADEYYPNLLIPASVIQTDPMLAEGVQLNVPFIQWFSKSWFSKGDNAPYIVPFNGYIAPPLDGVWITAPYLHNASVPTIEALLNSKLRPKYWKRDFNKPEYDYKALGWKYTHYDAPITKVTYNTTLKGYSNAGHYFGDFLSDSERDAVIEYLKTL